MIHVNLIVLDSKLPSHIILGNNNWINNRNTILPLSIMIPADKKLTSIVHGIKL